MILLIVLAWQIALAVCVPTISRWLGRDAGYLLAVGYVIGAGLLLLRLPAILADQSVVVFWRWLPSLEVSAALRMDSLAMIFALLVLGVGALIMAYCPRYLGRSDGYSQIYLLLTLFTAAMLGLVFANDLLVLLVFWELTSILSFSLISQAGPSARRPAVRALLVTATGGLALLAGVVVLVTSLGTSDLTRILAEPTRLPSGPTWAVGALVLVAAFTKSAQLPFHFWLPGAMAAITPVSAYLHAATMVKAGIYLLMRFSALFGGRVGWDVTLVVVGLLTAVVGAFLALRQYDLKALLAYSTVSQLGLLVGVIGIGTPASDAAAILYTIAHALFKATLFMLVGIIDHEAGSRDIRQLSGLRRVMPATVAFTALAAMSLAGLPPTIGFVGKEAIFESLTQTRETWWLPWVGGTLGVFASVLTFAYAARLVYGVFTGPVRQLELKAPPWSFLAPAGMAAVLAALLGPSVALLSPLVQRAANDARPQGEPPYLAFWHGVTLALGLSALTIVLGTVLFLLLLRSDRLLQAAPTPSSFAHFFERGYARLLGFGALVARPAHAAGPGPYLARPVLALVALAIIFASLVRLPLDVPDGLSRGTDWVLLVLIVVALAGLLIVREALPAIGLAGVVGLIMSAWFLTVGAPDVALTLMLVEVLTTVVMMLALRGRDGELIGRGRRWRIVSKAVLATAAGIAAAIATAMLNSRRELSVPGRYYLEEAETATGGRNVVNTILVEFRALDTLGEATVLTVVALGLIVLLGPADHPLPARDAGSVRPADLVLNFAYRLLAPVTLVVSGYLFVRGHEEIGGGFIGALVAGSVVGLGQLAYPHSPARLLGRLRVRSLLVPGLLLSIVVGAAGPVIGKPFLTLGKISLPGGYPLPFSSGMLFDLGVYLMVLALLVAAVRGLGEPQVDSQALTTGLGDQR